MILLQKAVKGGRAEVISFRAFARLEITEKRQREFWPGAKKAEVSFINHDIRFLRNFFFAH